jgi:chromosome segregation ATPase
MPTLKEQLETAQKEIQRLTSEGETSTETISKLEGQISELKKSDEDMKGKKAAKKDDGDPEDKKDGGDDEDQEDAGKNAKGKKAKTEAKAADVSLAVEVVDVTELKTKLETSERDLKNANARVKQLEGEAKTVDQTADVKAREIAARTGTPLPAKEHGAGDQTTDKKVNASAPWRARLSSFWKIAD